MAALVLFFVSGLSLSLRDFACGLSPHFAAANAIYLTALAAGAYLVNFPLGFFEGFLWEHKFKLSNQRLLAWVWDDIKKALIGLVLFLVIVEASYLFLRNFPNTWWLWASLFWLSVTLLLAKFLPNIIIPLFFKYSKIENEELKNSILNLFQKTGVDLEGAYVVDFSKKTKKANAFICGLGRHRRVVLSDTLVAQFSIPEIEAVVAHEIGHYKHHDVLRMTSVNFAVTFLGFFLVNIFLKKILPSAGLTRLDDIAFFPIVVLAFMLLGFLTLPLINGYSRLLEVKADAFSLKTTQRIDSFISMMRKLGTLNFSEFNPNPFIEIFIFDHPPINKRIKFAERTKNGQTTHG